MSFSTPAVIPRDTHMLWYHPTTHPPPPTLNDTTSANVHDHRQQHLQRRPPGSSHGHHSGRNGSNSQHGASSSYRSQLAQINHDESALNARKASIQRFGSTWLRPPGVRKTYAAQCEEAQERAEAAVALERERRAEEERQAALSMDINAEMETHDVAAPAPDALIATDVTEVDDGMGMERDLDDDVPEADGMDLDEEEDPDDSDEEDPSDEDVDEDGPAGEGVAAGLDAEPDPESSGLPERDLDDDVPEAGSYEHTDTEEEYKTDESDEGVEEEDEPSRPNPFQLAEARRVARERQQSSQEGSSSPRLLSYQQARRRFEERRQMLDTNVFRPNNDTPGAIMERQSSIITPENAARATQADANGLGPTTRSQSRRLPEPSSQPSSGQQTSPVRARGGAARANAYAGPQGPSTPARPLFIVHQGMPGGRPSLGSMAGGMASSPGDLAGQATPEIDPESSMILNSSPIGARGAGSPGGPSMRRGPRRAM